MHFQINGFHGVLQTSGFLAPGKKFGQLEVYNEENYLGPWDIASNSETEWSYHWVMWHDVDDDGLLDGVEDSNQDGAVDALESSPREADSDGDGIQMLDKGGKLSLCWSLSETVKI